MHVWCSLSLSPLYPCLWEEGFRKHLHVFSCLLLQKNREQGHHLSPFHLLSSWQTFWQRFFPMRTATHVPPWSPFKEIILALFQSNFLGTSIIHLPTVTRNLWWWGHWTSTLVTKVGSRENVSWEKGYRIFMQTHGCTMQFYFFPDGFAIGQEK